MTTQPALNENRNKIRDDLGSQTNPVPVNSNPYYRVIIISPKELRGEKLPKEFFDYFQKKAEEKYEEKILDNAMKNLGEVIEKPEPIITKTAEKEPELKEQAKPVKAENKDLDSMVNDYYNSAINNINENVIYNENGATLTDPNNLMAHYTTAGTNLFNNLGSKVKNIYNGIKNIKAGNVKKVGLAFTTLSLIAALTTGCGGVIPPIPNDDVADKYKVESIVPYYEKELEDNYCLISYGVITSNHKIEDPTKYLTQKEVGDAIFNVTGAKPNDLVDYINNKKDLNIQARRESITLLQLKKMLEDNIVPIVLLKEKKHAIMPVGYDNIMEEITLYSSFSGNEYTIGEFEYGYFNSNSNDSIMIIKDSELSTYLDNLSKLLKSSFQLS